MYCTYCGAPLKDGASFCTRCGRRVEDENAPLPVLQVAAETAKKEPEDPAVTQQKKEEQKKIFVLALVTFVLSVVFFVSSASFPIALLSTDISNDVYYDLDKWLPVALCVVLNVLVCVTFVLLGQYKQKYGALSGKASAALGFITPATVITVLMTMTAVQMFI